MGVGFLKLARHRVELGRQGLDLVASFHRDGLVEVAGRDLARGDGQRLDRMGNFLDAQGDENGRRHAAQRQKEDQDRLIPARIASNRRPIILQNEAPRCSRDRRKSRDRILTGGVGDALRALLLIEHLLHGRMGGEILPNMSRVGVIDHAPVAIHNVDVIPRARLEQRCQFLVKSTIADHGQRRDFNRHPDPRIFRADKGIGRNDDHLLARPIGHDVGQEGGLCFSCLNHVGTIRPILAYHLRLLRHRGRNDVIRIEDVGSILMLAFLQFSAAARPKAQLGIEVILLRL